jgi:hypothetical protein
VHLGMDGLGTFLVAAKLGKYAALLDEVRAL